MKNFFPELYLRWNFKESFSIQFREGLLLPETTIPFRQLFFMSSYE